MILTDIVRRCAIVSATGLATYWGIELGEVVNDYMPQAYLLPEITQGFTAFILGSVGHAISKKILGRKRISEYEAYSIAVLNAFANAPNETRGVSTEQSFDEINRNLVQIIVENEGNRVGMLQPLEMKK